MNEERKRQILGLSRRSRARWVLGALKHDVDAALITRDVVTSMVPGSESIDCVLGFLNELAEDGEDVRVEGLLALLPEEEEEEEAGDETGKHGHFASFLQRLRRSSPEVIALVRSMQQFVAKFLSELRSPTSASSGGERKPMAAAGRHAALASSIFTFLQHSFEEMRASPTWSREAPDTWAATAQHVEKFVFIKLHKAIFSLAVNDLGALAQDKRLHDRLAGLAFLSPEHLDLDESAFGAGTAPGSAERGWEQALQPAVEQLQRLSRCSCPVDALGCLRLAVEGAAALAKTASPSAGAGEQAGADALLPVLILAVKTAVPQGIMSMLAFVHAYLVTPARSSLAPIPADASFVHTSVAAACAFLLECDAVQLSVSPAEFERSLAKSRAAAKSQPQPQAPVAPVTAFAASTPCASNASADVDKEEEVWISALLKHGAVPLPSTSPIQLEPRDVRRGRTGQ